MLQAPMDYTMNVIDPFAAGLAGFQMGQQGRMAEQNQQINMQDAAQRQAMNAQGMEANAQNMSQDATTFAQGQEDRAVQQQRAQAFAADQLALAQKVSDKTATTDDFNEFTVKYPEVADEMKSSFDGIDGERRKNDAFELSKAITALKAGKPEVAIKMLEDRATAAENSGKDDDAGMARAMIEQIRLDPTAGLTVAGLALHQLDPEAAKLVFPAGEMGSGPVRKTIDLGGGYIQKIYDDRDEVIAPDGHVMTAEERKAVPDIAAKAEADAAGLKAGATETAKNASTLSSAGEIKSEEEAAKVNQQSVSEAGVRLATISSTINNYDDALSALDAGADTGVIAQKFPTLTQAGALLDNAKLRLGLDVIASVTFGALSEGERAAAMATALPTGLDPAALKQWITDRKNAELKVAKIQSDAIKHFSQTGKSQRDLRSEWVSKYTGTISGMDNAPEQATAANGETTAGNNAGPTTINSDAEYDALASGAEFIAPDGTKRRKP